MAQSTRHIEPLLPAGAAGPFVYTETGFAVAGIVGAGTSESIFQETGLATVSGVGAGASASVFQKGALLCC